MMTPEFVTLVNQFEAEFPGWTWLVRNDHDPGESGGYFVNLRSARPGDKAFTEEQFHPARGPTPESAFIAAIARVRAGQGRSTLEVIQ